MPRKTLNEAGVSKLLRQEREEAESPRLITPRRAARQPKSFRLSAVEVERFQRLANRLSEEAGRPISDTDILKGLLLLGERSDTKRILAALKDAIFESA